jgi:hypothetical protein
VIDIAHTLQRQGPPTVRLAIPSGVTDAASGASFELPVAADEALTAFHHHYAYAAAQGGAY